MTYNAGVDTIDRIAYLVYAARPDWDSSLVRVILLSHAMQVDGTDLAIAALRAASDPSNRSPKVIGWRGPHWDGLGTRPADQRTYTWCGVCGKIEPRCLSERFGDDDHEHEPTDRPVRTRR